MKENMEWGNDFFFGSLRLGLQFLFLLANVQRIQAENLASSGVHLIHQPNHVVMSNGIVSITLTIPGGDITNVTYKGGDNLLLTNNTETDRGHWDIAWTNDEGSRKSFDHFEGKSFKVVLESENQVEISFTRTWALGSPNAPLNVDKRYVMLRDSPGFYTYAVLEHLKGWSAFSIQEARIVFKLQGNKFNYMAISDERQRYMPTMEDRLKGQPLDYREAVLLTNSEFKGEVDDKYFYSCDNKDSKVYGWVSSTDPTMGFWAIAPSNEFRTGGPFKQDLTSHVGPTILVKFISRHYAGKVIDLKFTTEEYWKKVLGPVYIYLNSDASAHTDPSLLWNDAKQKMQEEEANWPYNFPLSNDFVKSDQRGAVSGQLLVYDWFINKEALPAASAYVGLAPPGPVGSWQLEGKDYQFWTQTDEDGNFLIKNVIPGNYNLFASIQGTLGDYRYSFIITITFGSKITLRNLTFEAPRNGPTLWEIGIPDRSAAEFFIPDPNPRFKIHPYKLKVEKFRQYGLWTRYSNMYPENDLIFTIGTSNYTKDWFFAHVTRELGDHKYVATTWQIVFDLKNVNKGANYTLQIALASANGAKLEVRINDPKSLPQFTTGTIGKDNALARHGIRGLYHLFSITIEGSHLIVGKNTIYLTQALYLGPFKEIMYDYIRLEGPNSTN